MLTLIATMLFPPVDVIEQPVAQPVAYEFAFSPEAGETSDETNIRLREEAMDYCRAATRAAGVRSEASNCARLVVAQVTARMGDATYATFASN